MIVVLRELNEHTEEIGRCSTFEEMDQIVAEYEKNGDGGVWFYTGEEGQVDDTFPKMSW